MHAAALSDLYMSASYLPFQVRFFPVFGLQPIGFTTIGRNLACTRLLRFFHTAVWLAAVLRASRENDDTIRPPVNAEHATE